MDILIAYFGLIIMLVSFYVGYKYWKSLPYVIFRDYLIMASLIFPILFGIFLMAC